MNWSKCRAEFAKHPREVCCIVAAHIAKCVWKPDEEWSADARSSWYQFAVSLLPPPGQWGPWRQVRGLAVAGDYFIRIHDEDGWLFVERAQLTQDELVCLDEILERAA